MSVEAEQRGATAVLSGEEGAAGPPDLHKELLLLAEEPQLASQRATLEQLALAVEHGEGLTAWSGGGLVAAYAGEGALAPRTKGVAVWARWLGSATAVLVYVPLILTWSGLGFAMYAYHEARQDRSAQLQGSFLEMWQQGFAGHLAGFLRFDALVWYTITLLVLVVAVTLAWRSTQRRADEQDRGLLRRLAHALARVEAAAVAAAHTEPRRFTEELQGAATELRALLGLSDRAGELSQKLLGQAVAASAEAVSATRTMDASAAALREAVTSVAAASRQAAAAAGHLTRGADGFGEAMQSSTATLTTGMVVAAEEAARRIVEAVTTASGRLTETTTASSNRFAEVVAQAVAGLEAESGRQADEVRTVLSQVRDALAGAAQELRESASGLERSVTVLPESLEAAAGTGADHVGLAYETAVTALAASLQAEVRQAGEALAAATAQALARQEVADRAAQERQLASEQRLLASASESRSVLVTLLQHIREHTERLAELKRHEETVRESDRENHRLRADTLRIELDLLDQVRERHERLLDAWADRHAPAGGPAPATAARAPATPRPAAPTPAAQTTTKPSPPPMPSADQAGPVPGPRPTGAV